MEQVKPMLALILVLQVASTVFQGLSFFQGRGMVKPSAPQEKLNISPYDMPLSQQGNVAVKKDDVVAQEQTPVPSVSTDDLQPGEDAPMFTMQDMDGKWYSLAQFRNSKNVVLVAWLQTCPHCLQFLPKFNEFAKKLKGNKKLQIITVTRAVTPDEQNTLRALLKTNGYNFPVLLSMGNNSFGQDYKLRGVPTVWVIDTNLKVRGFFRGSELDGYDGNDLKRVLLKPVGI